MNKYFFAVAFFFIWNGIGFLMPGLVNASNYAYSDNSNYLGSTSYGVYCRNDCAYGDHQCSGTTGRTCRNFNGCVAWDNYEACDSRCYTCGDGTCDSACGESQTSCPRDCGYGDGQNGDYNYRNDSTDSNCGNAPHAYAGPDKDVNVGESALLEGTADGSYDRVSWSCDGGTLLDGSSLEATWRDSNNYGNGTNYARNYNCTLTVYGNCGSNSSSMVVHVRNSNTNYNQSLSNMKVALIASPKTGCAPVRGIDLTATVTNYGTYNNEYTYYFDCENDGTWEKIITTNEPSYTFRNVCNYNNFGSATARVRVDSHGRSATDTDIIRTDDCGYQGGWQTYSTAHSNTATIYPAYPAYATYATVPAISSSQVSIQKSVSNLSNGTQYGATVTARPLDFVSYKIILAGVSGYPNNIALQDSLPAAITNPRDLRIDGVASGDNIESGINIGSLAPGQTKIITFTATVASENNFGFGQTALSNAATATSGSGSASARATVYVSKQAVQGATSISTGFGSDMVVGLAISLAGLILCLVWVLRKQIMDFFQNDPKKSLRAKIAFVRQKGLAQ